jgi:phosphatidylserine/phosphatidylglycerophosphate/cardiolipin synthase-like enzyme
MAIRLKVYRNGDDTFLVWQTDRLIEGCRGFAIYRKLNGGKADPMPSYAGFENQPWKRGTHKPSTVWPIQKFFWTDYTVRTGDSVSYRVVPMVGPSQKLRPDEGNATSFTPAVKLDAQVSKRFSCYFNRGVVATQWVQQMLGGNQTTQARARKLDKVVEDYKKNRERNLLAGELRAGLLDVLATARKKKAKVWAALFELTDEELLGALAALGKKAFVVLADGAVAKGKKKAASEDNDVPASKTNAKDENADARRELKKAEVEVHDRMTGGKFLAHNKFLVLGDARGQPRWTWTGSTNWTPSGLCTQANNGILIDDPAIAERFRQQAEALALAANASPNALAVKNTQANDFDDAETSVWFTRTLGMVDLKDASQYIAKAKQGALFLMFQTGMKNSLLEAIFARRSDKGFYTRGVISTPPATGGAKKTTGPKRKLTRDEAVANRVAFVHRTERVKYAPDLLLPFAIEKKLGWFDEFVRKNGAHAIVHSKIVVLDPWGKEPIVMTGSHNMGKNASSSNDENLVIVRGDAALAQAYAVNIMSIYDNYRWRFRVAAKSKWKGNWDNDRWQKNYLQGDARDELDLWMGKRTS